MDKIRAEATQAMKLISMLNVYGDAVDVVAAARQSLRNVIMLCTALEKESEKSEGPNEIA